MKARRSRPRRRQRPRRTPSAEEARWLELARGLTALARGGRPPAEALLEALATIGPGVAARRRPLDKASRLALAWAREQARLAVAELLDRAVKTGRARRDVPPDLLAWLLLAAGEALAREPVEAAADRLQALGDFIGGTRH